MVPSGAEAPQDRINESSQLVLMACNVWHHGAVFLLGLNTLPECHMVDNTARATNYQRQHCGHVLVIPCVVTAEYIGFRKGTLDEDIE